jgi:hypothetical protein
MQVRGYFTKFLQIYPPLPAAERVRHWYRVRSLVQGYAWIQENPSHFRNVPYLVVRLTKSNAQLSYLPCS